MIIKPNTNAVCTKMKRNSYNQNLGVIILGHPVSKQSIIVISKSSTTIPHCVIHRVNSSITFLINAKNSYTTNGLLYTVEMEICHLHK